MITFSYEKKPRFLTKDFKLRFRQLIDFILSETEYTLKRLHYHFCDDEELLALNKASLNHDYYTDVLTFNYSIDHQLMVEVFISLDRVGDNAKAYNVSFDDELLRVMIHGLLHCIGYDDKTAESKNRMTSAEDRFLEHFFSLKNVSRET